MPTAGSLRTRHQRGEPKAMNARVSHANTMHPCCCEHTENRATARRPRLYVRACEPQVRGGVATIDTEADRAEDAADLAFPDSGWGRTVLG